MVAEDLLKKHGFYEAGQEIERVSHGHINQTYIVKKDGLPKYILQRLNDYVFTNPKDVIHNFKVIKGHLDLSLRFRNHIPSQVIKNHVIHYNGYWRLFHYETDTHNFITTDDPDIVYKAAKAFGNFDFALSDLDAAKVKTVIPSFHDPLNRLKKLESSFKQGINERKEQGKLVYHRLIEMQSLAEEFEASRGDYPTRVVHNDTKLSNLLFDEHNQVKCVIDLDTVMPGLVITDFGDMVRSLCNPAGESEASLPNVYFDTELYEVIKNGFLEGWEGSLSETEVGGLLLGAKIIIYEQAVRFLTDYLTGDHYYQISYPEENRIRADVHLKLLEDLMLQEDLL